MRRVYAMIAYRESIQSNDFHAMELLSSPGYVLATSEKLSKQLEKEGDPGTHFDRFPNELPDHTQVKTLDDLMLSQEKWKEKIREDEDTRRAGTIAAAIHGSFEKASEKQRSGHTFLPKGTELVHQIMPVQRRDLVALYKLIDEQIYASFGMSRTMAPNKNSLKNTLTAATHTPPKPRRPRPTIGDRRLFIGRKGEPGRNQHDVRRVATCLF